MKIMECVVFTFRVYVIYIIYFRINSSDNGGVLWEKTVNKIKGFTLIQGDTFRVVITFIQLKLELKASRAMTSSSTLVRGNLYEEH